MAEFQVDNNGSLSRFEVNIDDESAYLKYVLGKNTISLPHTFTPESLRERGIASTVTRFALDYAKEKRLQVIAGCSFVALYVQQHPEYEPLLLKQTVREYFIN
jgi:predicted GNAT family acetyltransferase